MTIEFHCPTCGKVLRTADDKAGIQSKCPGCGEVVTIPALGPEQQAADFEQVVGVSPSERTSATAMSFADSDTAVAPAKDSKPCPMCGAIIEADAARCRFCGENLVAEFPIDAGAILGRAWALYQMQMAVCIAAIVIYFAITFALSFGMQFVQTAVALAARNDRTVMMTIVVFQQVILQLVINFLLLGISRVMLKVVRGERAEIVDVFSGGAYLVRAFLGMILINLLWLVIVLIGLVPGGVLLAVAGPGPIPIIAFVVGGIVAFAAIIWITLNVIFFMFCLVDRNVGIIEAFRLARQTTSGNMAQLMVLVFVWIGLVLVGVLACCVGVIFTMPLVMLTQAVAYLAMSHQPIAEARPTVMR